MDYRTFHLTSAVGSAAPLPIVPGDGFAENEEQRRADQIALTGRLHGYRWPAAPLGYAIPLRLVDSGTRADLTGWWRDQRELAFTFNLSSAPQSLLVRITNAEEPLGRRTPGLPDRFDGALLLRDSQGLGKASGAPFLLDDPGLGLLDQGAGVLL
jgi:hypothetical protein